MTQGTAKARKWGNSIGITLSQETVESESIKENDEVEYLIVKKDNLAKKLYGMFEGISDEPAQRIKNRLKKELYND